MRSMLGQYMTPQRLATFVAAQMRKSDVVVDLAVGDGALLRAVGKKLRAASLIGFDVDRSMVARSSQIDRITVRHSNGLTAHVPKVNSTQSLSAIGNPPFVGDSVDPRGWIEKVFPDVSIKKVGDRAEIQFLARALSITRASGGRVVFVMPIGFADGDRYAQVRASLMRQFKVVRCVEVAGAPFDETEARTIVLVIDPQSSARYSTEILEFDCATGIVAPVFKGILEPGVRLDARYHRARQAGRALSSVLLKDLEVLISRGVLSRKDAELRNVSVLHTSDLGKAVEGRLRIRSLGTPSEMQNQVVARAGDILLSRTGSRVCWDPVVLAAGAAPITDHVFRIRAPAPVRQIVENSFRHPAFGDWLKGISKGVCATVLTKRELLEMPVFAWPIDRDSPSHVIQVPSPNF